MVAALPVAVQNALSELGGELSAAWLKRGVAGFDICPTGYMGNLHRAKRPGTLRMVKAILKERGRK